MNTYFEFSFTFKPHKFCIKALGSSNHNVDSSTSNLHLHSLTSFSPTLMSHMTTSTINSSGMNRNRSGSTRSVTLADAIAGLELLDQIRKERNLQKQKKLVINNRVSENPYEFGPDEILTLSNNVVPNSTSDQSLSKVDRWFSSRPVSTLK